jgi:hypothetical protein
MRFDCALRRKPKLKNWRRKPKLGTGSWKLEAGNWELEAENWKLEAVLEVP